MYLAHVLAAPTVNPPTVVLPAVQLATKVGMYRNELNQRDWRGVLVRDGKLRAYSSDGTGRSVDIVHALELTPMSANRFVFPGWPPGSGRWSKALL
jgi:hypothetical protein